MAAAAVGTGRPLLRGIPLLALLVLLSVIPAAPFCVPLAPAPPNPCGGTQRATGPGDGGTEAVGHRAVWALEGLARSASCQAAPRGSPAPWRGRSRGREGRSGGWALPPLRMSSRPAEVPNVCPVPAGLNQAMEQCSSAVSSALLSGHRGMTIDVFTPDLDPTSRGFDMANMHRLSMGVADCLRKFTGDGQIKFVVQDFKKATSLVEALKANEVYGALLGEGKISVDSLLGSLSLVDSKEAAAVVLVMPTNTREAKVTKEVRDLLKSCREGITVIVNQALDTMGPNGQPLGTLPMEIDDFEKAFYLEPFTLQSAPQAGASAPAPSPARAETPSEAAGAEGEDSNGGAGQDGPSAPSGPAPLRIAVTRATPGEWGVWAFEDEDQRYELQKTFSKKPSRKALLEVCRGIIKSRKA